jgi:flagellar motility protein MotE (MotC chaperone)
MKKPLREFRLIPIVLVAIGCLLALKTMGLIFDGGYTLGERLGGRDQLVVRTMPASPAIALRSPAVPLDLGKPEPSESQLSWMQEMFGNRDITGSVAAKPAAKEPAAPGAAPKEAGKQPAQAAPAGPPSPPAAGPPPETRMPDGTAVQLGPPRTTSAAERALLERLQERRQALEARARELEVRENLLKAAEQKLEADRKAKEVKDGKGGAGGRKGGSDGDRFKSLVTMYETMKPKEAAKIFDRLDIRVLLEVASQMNPRQMSEIMAQMTPEAAERLTVELAARSGAVGADTAVNPANLPKIEGRPSGG